MLHRMRQHMRCRMQSLVPHQTAPGGPVSQPTQEYQTAHPPPPSPCALEQFSRTDSYIIDQLLNLLSSLRLSLRAPSNFVGLPGCEGSDNSDEGGHGYDSCICRKDIKRLILLLLRLVHLCLHLPSSIRQQTLRQHTSAYSSIRQHTSALVPGPQP
jgi:hypothetical protein